MESFNFIAKSEHKQVNKNKVKQDIRKFDIIFGYLQSIMVFKWLLKFVFHEICFFESLKVILITMVSILMTSAKLAALSLLKIMVFRNKVYYVIISVSDVTKKFYHVTQIIL